MFRDFSGFLLLISTLILFSSEKVHAGGFEWVVHPCGNYWDQNWVLANDPSGAVYVAGTFNSDSVLIHDTVFYNPFPGPSGDSYLLKYDLNGQFIWAVHLTGLYDESVGSVSIDQNGVVFIAGYFSGPDMSINGVSVSNFNPQSPDVDCFIAAIDPSGNLIWLKSFGGNALDYVSSIKVSTSGDLYGSGQFYSDSLSVDQIRIQHSGHFGSQRNADMMIWKMNASDGNMTWCRAFGNSQFDDACNALDVNQTGQIGFTGFFGSVSIDFDGEVLVNNTIDGTPQGLIAVLDTSGLVTWAKSFGGMNNDGGIDLKYYFNDHLLVYGNFQDDVLVLGTDTLQPKPVGRDLFITKLDLNGNFLNSASFGGIHHDLNGGLDYDQQGNILIGGGFGDSLLVFANDTLRNRFPLGTYNGFVAILDSGFFPLRAFGIDGASIVSDISVVSSGGVFAAGYFNSSPLQFGNISVSKCFPTTLREAFLTLISDSALSLPDVRLFPEFLVFPVPTTDRLYFRYSDPKPGSLSVFIQDLFGKTILQWNAVDFSSGLDLTLLKPGVYFLTAKADGIHVVRKIIKE
jgi:hypothetical protein